MKLSDDQMKEVRDFLAGFNNEESAPEGECCPNCGCNGEDVSEFDLDEAKQCIHDLAEADLFIADSVRHLGGKLDDLDEKFRKVYDAIISATIRNRSRLEYIENKLKGLAK